MEKKEKTLEQIKLEVEAKRNAYEEIKKQYAQMEQEEENRRQAELALEKEKRYKEVIDAMDKADELRSKFVKDYGWFTYHSETSGPSADTQWLIDFFKRI